MKSSLSPAVIQERQKEIDHLISEPQLEGGAAPAIKEGQPEEEEELPKEPPGAREREEEVSSRRRRRRRSASGEIGSSDEDED